MWQTAESWRQWITIGKFPDHPWRGYLQRSALALKGLTYAPTGALMAAATTSLPETPGGERNWDYRYAWVRDSTFALWGLYTLGLDREADDFFCFMYEVSQDASGEPVPAAGHVRHRRRADARGVRTPQPLRLRRRATGAHRQRRLQPEAARHLGHHARLGVPARPLARAGTRNAVAAAEAPGRRGHRALARPRPRHLGGARRAEALHVLEGDVLGRARPRRKLAIMHGEQSYADEWDEIADEIKADILPTASTLAECSPSTTAPTRWTRRCCWCRWCASCLGRSPGPRDRAGDRRRTHRGRAGAAVPDRRDRRRPVRRGGHVHDLLVLAGIGAGGDRRTRNAPATCANACSGSPARSSSTPRRSTPEPAATWVTSPRPSPTWPRSTR